MKYSPQQTVVPERTACYSQEPEGRGALIEGFTGYWRRLAAEHLVSITELLGLEPFAKVFPASSDRRERERSFRQVFYLLDGSEGYTEPWVEAMEHATCRRGLLQLTLASLTHVCDGSWLRRVRAWCPQCYVDQKHSGRPMYEPLIWSIRLISICPVHHLRLRERCPWCQKGPLAVAAAAPPGHCPHCKGCLGVQGTQSSGEQLGPPKRYELWCSEQICNVVRHLPGLIAQLDARTIARTLRLIFDRFPDLTLSALSDGTRTPRRSVSMWLKEARRPRIDTVCRFCFELRLPLLDFVTGRIQENTLEDREDLIGSMTSEEGGTGCSRTVRKNQALVESKDRRLGGSEIEGEQRESSGLRVDSPGYEGIAAWDTRDSGRPSKHADAESRETALRDALRVAIDSGTVASPRKIAMVLGYSSPDRVLQKCSSLATALKERIKDATSAQRLLIRTELEAALIEGTPPTLKEMAIRLGVSSSSALRLQEPGLCDRLLKERKRWKAKEWKRVIPIFERAMTTEEIPGFARFCKEAGFSPESIGAKFPALKEAYTTRFRVLREEKRQAEAKTFEQRVQKAVHGLCGRGEWPSVGKVVAEDTRLRRWGWDGLRRAIARAAASLGSLDEDGG